MTIITRYIDQRMAICELNSLIRDWLYQQPMCHDEKDLAKLKEVRSRLAEVYRFMEGREDVDTRNA
jgi:hypothetical protein